MDNITNQLHAVLDKIQALIATKTNKPVIISIAGGPGSGKSHFARLLHEFLVEFGYKGHIVEQDNFSFHDGITTDTIAHINSNLKWQLIHTILRSIVAGEKKLTLPVRIRNAFAYSPQTQSPYTIEYKHLDITDADFIIFEGAHALSDARTYNFFQYSDLGIFIDVSQENMRLWRKEREMAKPIELQRPPQIFEQQLDKGIEIYHTYVLPTKKNATFVICKQSKDNYYVIEQ